MSCTFVSTCCARMQAFETRTCYGNAANDHIVGWANSTLRYGDELPDLKLNCRTAHPKAKGVVHEDPLEYSWLLPENVPSPPQGQITATPLETPVDSLATGNPAKNGRKLKKGESKLRAALWDTASVAQRAKNPVAQSSESPAMCSGVDDSALAGLEEGSSAAGDVVSKQKAQGGEPGTECEV